MRLKKENGLAFSSPLSLSTLITKDGRALRHRSNVFLIRSDVIAKDSQEGHVTRFFAIKNIVFYLNDFKLPLSKLNAMCRNSVQVDEVDCFVSKTMTNV